MESSATESRHKIYYQNNKERRREESRLYYTGLGSAKLGSDNKIKYYLKNIPTGIININIFNQINEVLEDVEGNLLDLTMNYSLHIGGALWRPDVAPQRLRGAPHHVPQAPSALQGRQRRGVFIITNNTKGYQ